MKEEMLAYINAHINEHKQEQLRLRSADRADEAAHQQIIINVYGIFPAVYQATRYDLTAALMRFRSIIAPWEESRRTALAHNDSAKAFIEEIKLKAAADLIHYAEGLEGRA